jgi:RNA polymerase sigma-70 factor (ECF subfamily)
MADEQQWSRDAELLDAWRAGDRHAGRQLFERHADAVARFFENKVRERPEDLIQQTFLVLVEQRGRVRDGVAMRAFILGVARNVLREHLRTLARGRPIDLEIDSMAALAPGPVTLLARQREQRLLLEALRSLPIEHQLTLELYYWERFDAREIAEVVGISHSAMRSRLVKARELLRDAITRLAESPQLLESTMTHLDDWAALLREQLASAGVDLPGASS